MDIKRLKFIGHSKVGVTLPGAGGSTRPMGVYFVRDQKSDVTYGSGLL